MELGEKLRQARLEANLSQRQLCGETITRNMLSQIEHGTARPSMETLRYLAAQLGKPVSYFLDEHAVTSPNQQKMADARDAYAAGAPDTAWEILQCCKMPDPVFQWEYDLLGYLLLLDRAEAALKSDKLPYARELLQKAQAAERAVVYRLPELNRRRLLLQGKLSGEELSAACKELPGLDEELLLRAEAALLRGDAERAEALLTAAEDRENPQWNLLWGRICFMQKKYAPAAQCLRRAETQYAAICLPLLEACYRELGDFQQAYVYACKQR